MAFGTSGSRRRPRKGSLLVADALVLLRAAVEDPAVRGVALEPGGAHLELAAPLHGPDAVAAPGVLRHDETPLLRTRVGPYEVVESGAGIVSNDTRRRSR